MELRNQMQITEFIFLGFSGLPQGQTFLFLVFLVIYIATLVGNSMIFTLIQLNSHLHSLIYFLLSHLSRLNICFSSVTVPKILVNFLHERETISYCGCMAQMFFLMSCAGAERALLAVMAYDRYTAICNPLRYIEIISRRVCFPLAMGSWLWGILDSAIHTFLASRLSFCGANQLHHIFCDVPPLLKIACFDTYINEMMLHTASILVGLSPFLLIVISYLYILVAIFRIHSSKGRYKAFSTRAAHLIVVTIFFGMANLNYNCASTGYSVGVDTLVSILYCIVTPMLNPLIYSPRNQEVKGAIRKALGRQGRE
ncbi:olfactory receptor 5V1-like [Carettochelys insculpta]|uniref:olfactory receptor 5V1-like n=1 Tax=Carettochelys insculpta TaxID=44489 RepID=UPI003EBEF176